MQTSVHIYTHRHANHTPYLYVHTPQSAHLRVLLVLHGEGTDGLVLAEHPDETLGGMRRYVRSYVCRYVRIYIYIYIYIFL